MSLSENISSIDALFASVYKSEEPGAAVLIAQDGRVLHRKGYGMANLEFGLPNRPEMVFRVGSVTKQFTAVSILMLMEQGKLRLDDPIEKYLPDYPTHGHTITIEHLLTHTSGIKSFTGMAEYPKVMTQNLKTQEVIEIFKNQPMDFAPGKRYQYNNSAYFLLGVIIEKISGQPYAEFLQQMIFDPLAMTHTYYDSPTRIIPDRACGYDKEEDTVINSRYISMTIPYAAGALSSTVDDLACWDAALYTEKLLKQETLQLAWTPYRLLDGESTHYGYGWALHEFEGQPWIEHGGGINGYLCHMVRYPAERLFAAILTNTTGPQRYPGEMAFRAVSILLGRPYHEPAPVQWHEQELAGAAGVYQVRPGEERRLIVEEGKIYFQVEDAPRVELIPVEGGSLVPPHTTLDRIILLRNGAGKVTGFEWRNAFNEVTEAAQKVDLSMADESN